MSIVGVVVAFAEPGDIRTLIPAVTVVFPGIVLCFPRFAATKQHGLPGRIVPHRNRSAHWGRQLTSVSAVPSYSRVRINNTAQPPKSTVRPQMYRESAVIVPGGRVTRCVIIG